MSELMKKLKLIGELMHTQDNRITEIPLFVVQQKVRDYGYSDDYAEGHIWVDKESAEEEDDEATIAKLDKADIEWDDIDTHRKVGYKDRWEFVTACFTEQGCKDHIKINGHNLGEHRIFAASGFRNLEWQLMREFLMGLGEEST